MSEETMTWLNNYTLIGYAEKRGTAWHYDKTLQGTEPNHYDGPVPVEDVRRRLLDWSVIETAPLVTWTDPDGKERTQPYVQRGNVLKAYLRSDTGEGIGIASNRRATHGYDEWLLGNPASIVSKSQSELAIGSAGLLRSGAVMWVSIEMPETMKAPGDVFYRPQMLCATSFDSSLPTIYRMVNQIVVCDNTLSAGMSEKTEAEVRIRHTAGSALRIGDARDALKIVHGQSQAFSKEVGALLSEAVSEKRWEAFLAAYVPVPEAKPTKGGGNGRGWTVATAKQDALRLLWSKDERVAPWKGTAYGVLAAVNTWNAHLSQVKNADVVSRSHRNRMNVLTGKSMSADVDALSVLAGVA